ncbi:MAG: DUF3016 domain-containing protein [Opitutales bacterium]
MKATPLLLAAAFGLVVAGTVQAADTAANARVQVTFVHPEKFTDVRDAYMPSKKGMAANLDSIRQFVEQRAAEYLPAGQRLEVKFTDIDLAGEFEPWRQPGADSVRIVRDIYPPRMDLTFKVTDAAGTVIKEGKRQLRDLNFMSNFGLPTGDTLRYEKQLLDDWMRRDLKPRATQN